jgi:ApaG protein
MLMLVTQITLGVKITVDTQYQADYSDPACNEYMFSYKVTIENANDFAIKLLRRYWNIYDSNGCMREVQGDGVVGVQPIIQPGDSYTYMSSCNLHSELGKMYGHYEMENQTNKILFKAAIPLFKMTAPCKLN